VDPARFGDDSSVIYTRVGRDGRTWPALRFAKLDTMQLAARVAERANFFRASGLRVAINVDGGGVGGGVVDRLRSLGYEVNEIQFGARALDPKRFANRRAELWSAMRDWLAVGALPRDQELATDLTSPEFGYDSANRILLERKESMKARGLASPDTADALAVTFGATLPVAEFDSDELIYDRNVVMNYDPLALLNRR
jgi:hypothetical protein